MRAVAAALLIVSIAGSFACAHDTRSTNTAGGSTTSGDAPEPAVTSRYREMTWEEYYAQVTERVWRRGGTIVWVNPPGVRKGKRPVAAREVIK